MVWLCLHLEEKAMRRLIPILALVALLPTAVPAGELPRLFSGVNAGVVEILTTQAGPLVRQDSELLPQRGLGSGFLISRDGLVMTAAHVVHVAEVVYVRYVNGEVTRAHVVASDQFADVALVRAERVPDSAVVIELGDSDEVQVGDDAFVVGAPYGLSHTLTVGYISARHKPTTGVGSLGQTELFQTDAAINQGNSGGPLFNMKGEAIGVVSLMISKTGGYEGLGFAVTSNTARRRLLEERAVWTGVDAVVISGDTARILNVPQAAGLLIQRVASDSAVARAGLQGGTRWVTVDGAPVLLGGDIVLAVEGIALDSPENLRRAWEAIRRAPSGAILHIKILRAGQTRELEVER
jgi:S1-C subfamily serine protease